MSEPDAVTTRAGLGAIVTRLLAEHWPNSGVNGWYLTDLLREEGVRVVHPAAASVPHVPTPTQGEQP